MVSSDMGLAVAFVFVSHCKCCKTEDHENQKTFPGCEDWREDLGCDFDCECDVFHNSNKCRVNEWTGRQKSIIDCKCQSISKAVDLLHLDPSKLEKVHLFIVDVLLSAMVGIKRLTFIAITLVFVGVLFHNSREYRVNEWTGQASIQWSSRMASKLLL